MNKLCTKCRKDCPFGQFYRNKSAYDGLQTVCKSCTAVNNAAKTTEYHAWVSMKTRCYSKTCNQYKDYGGRGIVVCPQWLTSFSTFLQDVGLKPNKFLSLDRINNDGNYEPKNCRWATPEQQANNRRVKITPIPHGTRNGYNHHRCRCEQCGTAQRQYRRAYRLQIKLNRVSHYCDTS